MTPSEHRTMHLAKNDKVTRQRLGFLCLIGRLLHPVGRGLECGASLGKAETEIP